jgi:hypothetical protein
MSGDNEVKLTIHQAKPVIRWADPVIQWAELRIQRAEPRIQRAEPSIQWAETQIRDPRSEAKTQLYKYQISDSLDLSLDLWGWLGVYPHFYK